MVILSEQKLSLPQAARRLGVNPSTVWRWTLRGVRGVMLETISIGAKRFTSAEALERFVEATTAAARGPARPTVSRTSKQRQRAIEAAERELDAAGI